MPRRTLAPCVKLDLVSCRVEGKPGTCSDPIPFRTGSRRSRIPFACDPLLSLLFRCWVESCEPIARSVLACLLSSL